MRVFIAGIDGYLGWSLSMYLTKRGHEVAGADNYYRRDWVQEMGSQSVTPIQKMTDRLEVFRKNLDLYFWLYGVIFYKIYTLERKRLPDENLIS